MKLTFDYAIQFPDESEETIEFEAEIVNGGFSHDWHGGGFESYPEIDNITFGESGLTIEQIKYIEDNIVDSDKLIDKIWEEYENNN
jgi:hypothetical protein